ncbi:MAG: phosphopantetheine-binding protein [Longicatena sp.]
MAELLEEDSVQLEDKLTDFEAWDSLTQLSIIALVSEKYGVVLSAVELRDAETISGLQILIENKQ